MTGSTKCHVAPVGPTNNRTTKGRRKIDERLIFRNVMRKSLRSGKAWTVSGSRAKSALQPQLPVLHWRTNHSTRHTYNPPPKPTQIFNFVLKFDTLSPWRRTVVLPPLLIFVSFFWMPVTFENDVNLLRASPFYNRHPVPLLTIVDALINIQLTKDKKTKPYSNVIVFHLKRSDDISAYYDHRGKRVRRN